MNCIGSSCLPDRRLTVRIRALILTFAVTALAPYGRAQWLTQSIQLKPGWNAVFLHVDASHRTLNATVGNDSANPIQEVWRWNPPPVAQFTDNPAEPMSATEWTAWNRTNSASALQRLTGDTAYLVRVGTGVETYEWNIKGRPIPPRHSWSTSGLNLIGFPTVPANPPTFAAFLANAPELQGITPEIYLYNGGDLGPGNPVLLASPLFAEQTVQRGAAFWMRAGSVFNRYFGPFEVELPSSGGIHYGEEQGTAVFRLRNRTDRRLTVRLALQSSAAAPGDETEIAGDPPLLIRTELDQDDLTYGYTNLPTGVNRTWSLAPSGESGAEVEVVLGLNRASITNAPGSLLAGILRFTDSLGQLQIHVPVTATVASTAGLWVGEASVNQVAHALNSFQRDASNAPVVSESGKYIVTGTDTSLGAVPESYPLRLIVHSSTNNTAVLLQRVYYGLDSATNPVVATGESVLNPAYLKQARRITAAHLPWSANNTGWAFDGRLGEQASLTATVALSYDDQAANPFLHTYHPDHDNLNATFDGVLAEGAESYGIQRDITLHVQPASDDFVSLVSAATTLRGNYQEVVQLRGASRSEGVTDRRQLEVRGVFQLKRVSDLPGLTVAP